MPIIDEIDPNTGMRVIGITDDSMRYRWWLERQWDEALPTMTFIGFNPRSDGRHLANDPTTARCIQIARDAGCGGIVLVNLFARRSETTADLVASEDPVGDECDEWITHAVERATTTVAAWGVPPGWAIPRSTEVLERLPDPQCLDYTAGGHPRHPSRVGRSTLQPYRTPTTEAKVVAAFGAWLESDGWTVRYEADGSDVVATRDDETIVAQAKGLTSGAGLDVDTMYGQLLRRMADYPAGARFAVVVPADMAATALRVPRAVRRALAVDVYTVDGSGVVERRWD